VAVSLAPLLRAFPNRKGYLAVLFTVPAIFIVKSPEDAHLGIARALFSGPSRSIGISGPYRVDARNKPYAQCDVRCEHSPRAHLFHRHIE
jgi:hypothetical protein